MSEVATKIVKRSEVPEYLHSSALFASGAPGDICVPQFCIRNSPYLETVFELEHMLMTLQFWKVKYIPKETIHFLLTEEDDQIANLLKEYDTEFPGLLALVTALPSPRTSRAPQTNSHGMR